MLQFTPAYFVFDEPNLAKKLSRENAPYSLKMSLRRHFVSSLLNKKRKLTLFRVKINRIKIASLLSNLCIQEA